MEMIGDIITNSKLNSDDIEAERGVILREKEEIESNMLEYLLDHLHAISYQKSPLGMTILGTDENINSINRNQISDYIKTNYRADNAVVAAVGGQIDHDTIVSLADKHFRKLASKNDCNFFTYLNLLYFYVFVDF